MAADLVITHPGAVHANTQHDAWTVASIAVIVFALSSLLHEAAGHGGACLAVQGDPRFLSSMHFDCAVRYGAHTAERMVAAGGPIATLALGGLAALLYQRTTREDSPVRRYTLWLFAAVNLMQATGYLLYSGLGDLGDWSVVIDGWTPASLWRVGLVAIGLPTYVLVTAWLFRQLTPLAGEARPRRYLHARRLGGIAYVAGAALEVLAGLGKQGGGTLVLLSGVAASLVSTSGLLWGPRTLRGPRTPSTMAVVPVELVERSWTAIILAATCAAAFIVLLGRGLRLDT